MKVEKAGSATGPQRVGRATYAKRAAEAASVSAPAPVGAVASVMGIPEAEFTPRVRDAVMALMREVDSLRQQLAETKERLEEVEKAADQDHLLPLLNRRAFVRELMRYIAFAERYATPSTLIYFDLNDFKQVNDSHGHAAGDAVLAHFADLMLRHVRDSDVVGRLGGDEFGVLLSHAGPEQGRKKADSLAAMLNAEPTQWNGLTIPCRFSYGVFELKPGETADSAIARADQAMYAHKRANR